MHVISRTPRKYKGFSFPSLKFFFFAYLVYVFLIPRKGIPSKIYLCVHLYVYISTYMFLYNIYAYVTLESLNIEQKER